MILALMFCAASLGSAHASPALLALRPVVEVQDKQAEYDSRRKEAGRDPEKLWDVYLWCDANGLEKEGRSVLRAVVRADQNHRPAHEKLGHFEYDGQWFTTQKKLDKYKKKRETEIAKEKGLVRFKGEWVSKDDLPFLERGMVRNDEGQWISAEVLAKIEAGWILQDATWISPEEMPNIEKGLWKCGERWLSLEDANGYHKEIGKWWVIPGDHFTLYTTCDRDAAKEAIDHMERAYRDMGRVLGTTPATQVNVGLMRNLEQYCLFAAGSDAYPMTEARGLSSLHSAYLADLWFNPEPFYALGAGVGYWDASTENGTRYGRHAVRHAAGLSLVEAVDPSPDAFDGIRKRTEPDTAYTQRFWTEKKFPEWFRYGAASYVDRYFVDQFVGRGGNPHWAREWSIQNLMSRGGLRPVEEVFSAELSVDTREDSEKLLNEQGLVIAFIVDGKCPPVIEKHALLKRAIRDGKGLDQAFKDLEAEVVKNKKALLDFAGM
jgi:hypothetical protein